MSLKKEPPTSLILLFMILAISAIVLAISSWVCANKANAVIANLSLADDASTPEAKAKYLRRFLSDMEERHLPSHGAWVWTSERNKIENQKDILLSLAKRCDDLAAMDKSSFGYAQGMTQVTGQEFDHALKEVGGIYKTAIIMSYGFVLYFGWAVCLGLAIVVGMALGTYA